MGKHVSNDNKHNYPFCRLELKVEKFGHHKLKQTNHDSIKVSIVFKPPN